MKNLMMTIFQKLGMTIVLHTNSNRLKILHNNNHNTSSKYNNKHSPILIIVQQHIVIMLAITATPTILTMVII